MTDRGPHRAAVLTVSDLGARGQREDTAGPVVAALLRDAGFEVADRALLPDEPDQIEERLVRWSEQGYALVITAGGTGLSRRDCTPEATLRVIDYRVPGMEEAMRAANIAAVPTAMLSRAVVGVRGHTLIVNLPGSERAARENLGVVLPVLAHACDSLTDDAGGARKVAAIHEQLRQLKDDA
ncbi:MAG: MogA/MoaB family molybdenum cofactor biosynthesis protein [Dehalococcoidia bacterium]|nr:MogA/MoaB family molybdenum cofactor biosynthesis protein [Dehalococcoidia bacterium]